MRTDEVVQASPKTRAKMAQPDAQCEASISAPLEQNTKGFMARVRQKTLLIVRVPFIREKSLLIMHENLVGIRGIDRHGAGPEVNKVIRDMIGSCEQLMQQLKLNTDASFDHFITITGWACDTSRFERRNTPLHDRACCAKSVGRVRGPT